MESMLENFSLLEKPGNLRNSSRATQRSEGPPGAREARPVGRALDSGPKRSPPLLLPSLT